MTFDLNSFMQQRLAKTRVELKTPDLGKPIANVLQLIKWKCKNCGTIHETEQYSAPHILYDSGKSYPHERPIPGLPFQTQATDRICYTLRYCLKCWGKDQ